jgi:hypothetical protein
MAKIRMIKVRYSDVSERKFQPSDVDRVLHRLPQIYRNYITIMNYAKIILNGGSILSESDKGKHGIVPYAINSHVLFECYARACVKEYIKGLDYVRMLKYVPDKSSIPADPSYGAKDVLKAPCNDAYISGKVIPDIVLEYDIGKMDEESKNTLGKKEGAFFRVYDVKYKDAANSGFGRNDRLQLLAYNLLFDGNDNTGFIFPENGHRNAGKYINLPDKTEFFGLEIFFPSPQDSSILLLREKESNEKKEPLKIDILKIWT